MFEKIPEKTRLFEKFVPASTKMINCLQQQMKDIKNTKLSVFSLKLVFVP
jgi:hypothetical protein